MAQEMITGTVKTDSQGSEVTFEICSRSEFTAMTEEQRSVALVNAMWESGVVDVYANFP